MEVLGNEALGKIIKLVDENRFLLDMEFKTFSGKRAKRPGGILNILSAGGPGVYLPLGLVALHTLVTSLTQAGSDSALLRKKT